MAKDSTFSVSKRGVEPIEVRFAEPENINDPRWEELGVTPEGINELATQSLVIKIQAGARNNLEKGPKAVQEFVDTYKYGQRTGGGTRKVVIKSEDVQKAGFTVEQIELLRAAGVSIPGLNGESEENGDASEGEVEGEAAALEEAAAETTGRSGRNR
jgi:hypothetical protein